MKIRDPPATSAPKGEVGLRQKAATLGSILALIALVVGSLFGDRGILYLVAQRERTEALRREIEELRARERRPGREIRPCAAIRGPSSGWPARSWGSRGAGETVFLIRGRRRANRRQPLTRSSPLFFAVKFVRSRLDTASR